MANQIFRSFSFAFQGIAAGIQERNMKIHLLATLVVLFLGFFFQISRIEWTILLLCIGMVIITELLNTAIEEICNVIAPLHQEAYQRMGKPKDVAAGAVLIAASLSLIIGSLIFFPYIYSFLT